MFSKVFEIKSGEVMIGLPFTSFSFKSLRSKSSVVCSPSSNTLANAGDFVYRLATNDSAIILFPVLMSVVVIDLNRFLILPVLPNTSFSPYRPTATPPNSNIVSF